MDKYAVEYNGQVTVLNSYLVESRHIDDETLERLKETHVVRLKIFEAAREAAEHDDVDTLRKLASIFTALEFEQQALWGFSQDADFHRWFDLPGCTCPKSDNVDRLGTPYSVIDLQCPIHGSQGYHGDC
jgi:hypothetical protein